MLSNVVIGQYYPAKSHIHSLDPRVKLLAVVVYVAALFVADSWLGYGLTAACLGLVIYASNVPPVYLLRGLRAVFMIIVFTAFLNIFFTPGTRVIFSFWIFTMTAEGLITAFRMTLRLVLLITGSSLLTLTTSPIQLTDAIEFALKPLKKIKVPAHELAMMMTIALRFIPTLLEETDKIMKAQMARGADFDTGGLMKKARSLVPLLVPLFLSCFRRADELAMAMEARCYRGDINRTRMKQMLLTGKDYKALGFLAGYAAAGLLSRLLYS
ncbi:MAG: energy-coupling factor transporter transmembrane protein EcfT [Clostridiales bacterium]|jgi:energy-coupling factor transport system permease protein|nr:energy-coupling factor transporter transmembrane protein EcfT [Clostridiales bacterium]